jgi:hypothetical protein
MELAEQNMDTYYSCCGKSNCGGCIHSFGKTGNNEKCPFCNAETEIDSDAEKIGYIMKRVDTGAIDLLGTCYYNGLLGFQQDETKAIELWMRAAELGFSKSHNYLLGMHYYHGENWKKAKDTLIFYSSIIQTETELLSIGSLLHLLGHILP